jgi:hypothetical protein
MQTPRFNLVTLLLWAAALPIWMFLAVVVAQSTGWGGGAFRFVAAPLVLCGVTVVIHRLVRGRQTSWALAALFAGILILGSLSIAAWWARSQ